MSLYLTLLLALVMPMNSMAFIDAFFSEDEKKEFTRPADFVDFKSDALSKEDKILVYVKSWLGKIKYSILVGNLERAKVEIYKFKDYGPGKKIQPMLERYLATIFFLEEEYSRSLEILNQPIMRLVENRKKVCHLKVLNMIILNITEGLQEEWSYCGTATDRFSSQNQAWLRAMVKLKTNKDSLEVSKLPFKGLRSLLYSKDHARVWLKLGLYLNQPDILYPFMRRLPSDYIADEEIRELMGMIYYRDGELVKSYQFIEDLNTPNVENIKGNLYLLQEKEELAFAQFKLALSMKQNSLNAFERILPLAWRLGRWQEGVKYSSDLKIYQSYKNLERVALKAAFLTQMRDFRKAIGEIRSQKFAYVAQMPLEMAQIMSYSNLMIGRGDDSLPYATLSCRKLDAVNCWTMYQLSTWDNFPNMIQSKQKLNIVDTQFLDDLKTYDADPIKEENYIEQKDIEELDRALSDS
jgi:hypothetical protein